MPCKYLATLILLLALMASGCARTAPSADSPLPTEPPPSTIPNPPTTPEMVDAIDLSGRAVRVAYWHQRPQADQDLLQRMLDEFNRTNPYGIQARAEIAGVTFNDVYNRANAAIQAGEPPDISVASPNQAAMYRAQGAVIDLTPFIRSRKYGLSESDMQGLLPFFVNGDANPQFQGERLSLPSQRAAVVMVYNADWLGRLGFSTPPHDWKTWEEMACKASDPAANKAGWAFRHEPSDFASQVLSRGGRILSPDASAYVFNDQAGIDTVALIQRLFKNRCAAQVPYGDPNGEQDRFASGQVLFAFASSSVLANYQQAVSAGAGFRWGVAPLPYVDRPTLDLTGTSLAVYKTTPERELAAWLVIKFLSERAQTARWAIQTGFLPVRKSAQPDVINAYRANPRWGPIADQYAHVLDWVRDGVSEPTIAAYDLVQSSMDRDVMTKVVTDYNVDPKKLLDTAVSKANGILKANAPR